MYSKAELKKAIKYANSYRGTIRNLNIAINGGNYKTLKKYIELWNLDISHWTSNRAFSPKKTLKEILVVSSSFDSSNLKKRLLKEGILEERCFFEDCPSYKISSWRGRPMTYHLDHINGIRDDNRIENVRILCIVCHSHTDTYGSKNFSRPGRSPNNCINCNIKISRGASRCIKCSAVVFNKEKLDWPPIEVLLKEIAATNMHKVSIDRGYSYNTLKKHVRKHTIGYLQQ